MKHALWYSNVAIEHPLSSMIFAAINLISLCFPYIFRCFPIFFPWFPGHVPVFPSAGEGMQPLHQDRHSVPAMELKPARGEPGYFPGAQWGVADAWSLVGGRNRSKSHYQYFIGISVYIYYYNGITNFSLTLIMFVLHAIQT